MDACRNSFPLVRLEHVDVSRGGRTVLADLCWELHPGQHWLVSGGNGAGKSTFMRLVRGEQWPAPGSGPRTYCLGGAVTTSPLRARERFALVSAEGQLFYERSDRYEWSMTGRELVATGWFDTPFLYTPPSRAQWERVDGLMAELGVEHLGSRDMHQLSQGERRRLLIARAMVRRPEVLLLDEGCAGLDAAAREEVLRLVDNIAGDGTTILFSSHRADEVPEAISHGLALSDGRITAAGPREQSAPPPELPAVRAPRRSGRVLIELERVDLHVEWTRVLSNLSWRLRAGEHWHVAGRNGTGKTTLLRLLAGELHHAAGGRVRRLDLPERTPIWELRRHVGYVSAATQAAYQENATAEEVVGSGFGATVGLPAPLTPAQRRRVAELMAELALESLAGRRFLELSYGQARRLLIARAIVHRPAVLLLDEALDGLDSAASRRLVELLSRIAANGTSLVMVSHHHDALLSLATHRLILEGGRIASQGPLVRGGERSC